MTLRKATADDIPLLIKLRIDFINDDRGGITPCEQATIEAQLEKYFPRHLKDGSFAAVLAEENGEVVSTAFLAVTEKPANTSFITGVTGMLLNVMTYPAYRRKGIATRVISCLLEEAKILGVSCVDLQATTAGKPLYEKLGFKEPKSTAMRLNIK